MFSLSKQEKIVFLILISVLVIAFSWNLINTGRNTITIIPAKEMNKNTQVAENPVYEEICIIHIAGAVNQPGVYQLSKGKRIIDAVEIAGGVIEKANIDAVNLAAPIHDGQKIFIPFILENNERSFYETNLQHGIPQQHIYSSNANSLNLNAANSYQLESLPGIGPVLSKRILEHRERHGFFQKIEDIMNVPGIGEKKFENIKEHITVY